MSYRTIKRIIGETNLERKCRFLFGACLLLLIVGSFWWYGKATDELVKLNTRSTCRHLVDAGMTKLHAKKFLELERLLNLLTELAIPTLNAIESMDYDWTLLSLEDSDSEAKDYVSSVLNEWEKEHLPDLKSSYEIWLKTDYAQWKARQEAGESETGNDLPSANEVEVTKTDESTSLETTDPLKSPALPFAENPDGSRYYFYQPVHWNKDLNCTTANCHTHLEQYVTSSRLSSEFPSAEVDDKDLKITRLFHEPFRVVRVTIDYGPTQNAINKNRAILLATAIITVFISMVALYVVVRYVIVKPLKHLIDVSDEIGRGSYKLRAEIETNDEFEDLADSFNRMLRHLVEAHQELRNVNEDLDHKVDELAQANMQLFEANRLKSDFLANMSHELRTPLNSIIGFADVLKDLHALNARQKRYAHNIGQSGRVLLEMINDILDLAKMESGKMDVSPTEFSIQHVVNAQCDIVRSLTEEKNIDLDVQCIPDPPPMCQDQSKVQQILTNLLSNAIKFTPEGGRICVKLARDHHDMLHLSVVDTGVGIAEEDRAVIFEKFRQGPALKTGDNLTREFAGTGLGLSIVKELCKLLGGEISFESELGKGSEFTVRLPWNIDRLPRRSSPLSERLDELTSASRAESQRVLGTSAAHQATDDDGVLTTDPLPVPSTLGSARGLSGN